MIAERGHYVQRSDAAVGILEKGARQETFDPSGGEAGWKDLAYERIRQAPLSEMRIYQHG